MTGSGVDITRHLEKHRDDIVALCRRHHVRELSIFGSALTGDFRADSDIDMLVDFDPGGRVGFMELMTFQAELEELLARKVDLVPRNGLRPLIRDQILSLAQRFFHAA